MTDDKKENKKKVAITFAFATYYNCRGGIKRLGDMVS